MRVNMIVMLFSFVIGYPVEYSCIVQNIEIIKEDELLFSAVVEMLDDSLLQESEVTILI